MKEKAFAYLVTQYPEAAQGINFSVIKDIGQPSIKLLLGNLLSISKTYGSEIDRQEESMRRFLSTNAGDILTMQEMGLQLAFKRTQLGNRKYVAAELKRILAEMRYQDLGTDLPVMPILRNLGHFAPGDDVMVYLPCIQTPEKSQEFTGDQVSPYDWVCAKVIDIDEHRGIDVYCMKPAFNLVNLEGHALRFYPTIPTIFKRKEFYEIRRILEHDPENRYVGMGPYIEAFLKSCQRWVDGKLITWKSFREIKSMILSENIDPMTDEALKKEAPSIIAHGLSVARKNEHYESGMEQLLAKC